MARWRKLGVIAGGGGLPVSIVAACHARDEPIHVIRISGLTDAALAPYPGNDVGIGEAGKILRILKENNCDAVVFAGIVARPNFSDIRADWRGAALLPSILSAASRGDGALLRVLVDTLEAEGFIVVGAEEAAQGLAATAGVLGKNAPSEVNLADMKKAAALIHAIGEFDAGQAAVVSRGLVLAIEAAEGTDAMLDRCALLPKHFADGGVLVKRPKPSQEMRIDLPVIGVETIRRAAGAHLAGIAVEAENALIIDQASVVKLADELGLFVYGFKTSELRET